MELRPDSDSVAAVLSYGSWECGKCGEVFRMANRKADVHDYYLSLNHARECEGRDA